MEYKRTQIELKRHPGRAACALDAFQNRMAGKPRQYSFDGVVGRNGYSINQAVSNQHARPVRLAVRDVNDNGTIPSEVYTHLVEAVIEEIIKPVFPEKWLKQTKFLVNPTGRFVIGGPQGDCGLTGRKIIVDTYGGMARHGGGCFSGKDPSKVDRSAAYAARYVAKNIVAAGLADRCEVQLSYAIGLAKPTSMYVNTFGTSNISNQKIIQLIEHHFDLRPHNIIHLLQLLQPIYLPTATYGHFGRDDLNLSWEITDKAELLSDAAKK